MSVAILEASEFPEVTQVDAPVLPRRLRGRLTRVEPPAEEAASEAPERRDGAVSEPLATPVRLKAGRLSELYVRSVEARKTSSPQAKEAAPELGRPRLLLARVDDPGLRLRRRPSGFELSGQASPKRGREARRLAIAFDGELFAIILQPSESIESILGRLQERLRGRYDLSIDRTSSGVFQVSFAEFLSVSA